MTQTTQHQRRPNMEMLIVMSEDNYNNRQDKFIATQKPNKVKVSDVAAKACAEKLCNCPGSKPGIVSSDIDDHEIGCHIRKRILSGRYGVNTSVIPRKIHDGYSLGVAIGAEVLLS